MKTSSLGSLSAASRGCAAGVAPADDPGELLPIYDEGGTLLGHKPRGAVHLEGDWHWCFDCWIIAHDEAGRPAVLLQQRSMGKDTWPGRWDISAAGHYRPGESVAEGVRELAEELGVEAKPEELLPLGVRVAATRQVTAAGTVIDREFQDTYFLRDERALSAYHPSPNEVMGLAHLSVADGHELLTGMVASLTLPGLAAGDGGRWFPVQHELTARSFIPSVDSYLLKVLALAERALQGERLLYI
ncbi:MAG: NUDIX hydrolase [Dehalococcoidia bacterium]|nr:NUDIX hydrolase [Dehalococcoidia bacterium]